MLHPRAALTVLAVLCACSGEEPSAAAKAGPGNPASKPAPPPKAQPADSGTVGEEPAKADPADQLAYTGPPLRAAFEKSAQGQGQELRVTVTVPGGGWQLQQDGIEHRGSAAVLLLTLTEPDVVPPGPPATKGSGSVAYMRPLEKLTENAGAAGVAAIRVEVAHVVRGRQYFVAPPHLLAAVVPVPR